MDPRELLIFTAVVCKQANRIKPETSPIGMLEKRGDGITGFGKMVEFPKCTFIGVGYEENHNRVQNNHCKDRPCLQHLRRH